MIGIDDFESLKVACEALGISYSTARVRLKRGWTPRQALGLDPRPPKAPGGKKREAFGKKQNLTEWAEETGIPVTTLRSRIHKGATLEDAIKRGNDHSKLSTPRYEYKGEMLTINQLCQLSGLNYNLLQYRLKIMHLTAEEAITRKTTRGGYRGWHKYPESEKKPDVKLKGDTKVRRCRWSNCFTCPYEDCIA